MSMDAASPVFLVEAASRLVFLDPPVPSPHLPRKAALDVALRFKNSSFGWTGDDWFQEPPALWIVFFGFSTDLMPSWKQVGNVCLNPPPPQKKKKKKKKHKTKKQQTQKEEANCTQNLGTSRFPFESTPYSDCPLRVAVFSEHRVRKDNIIGK